MKNSTLKGLSVVFAVLAAVTIYDYYHSNSEKENILSETQIIPFVESQISEVVIEKESEKIYLQRGVDGWQMLSPIKDWCDNQEIDEMVSQLTKEKYKSVANNQENINLKTFGLDLPKAVMTFKNNQGQEIKIKISSLQNFEGDQFLQIQDQSRVLVASSAWGLNAGKNSTTFRDRRLVRYKMASLQELVFQDGALTETLKMENGKWVDPVHPNWILDQNKVREYLNLLVTTEGSEFIWQGDKAEDFVKNKYGLNQAVFHLHLKLNDIDWRADFSKDKEKWTYALTNLPGQILKIEPGQFQKIQNFSVNSMRDLSVPFNLKENLISEVFFKNKVKQMVMSLQAGVWKIKNDDKIALDPIKVKNFLDKFKATKAFRFVQLKNKMTESLQFKNDKNEILLDLQWSEEFKITEGPVEKEVVLAQSSLVKDQFLIEKSELSEWGLADIYK